jgi:hypothetical protein
LSATFCARAQQTTPKNEAERDKERWNDHDRNEAAPALLRVAKLQ